MTEKQVKQGDAKKADKPKDGSAPKRDRAGEIARQGFSITMPGQKPKHYGGDD